ncbi:MAG TPA: 5-oxoprolinase subunit PxpB [Planococcus sp. (in: firmicutes)]|nr:5-oxoprolinase subunit PxpB [Planococcus sp. (in: firmicutes)]
MDYSFSSLGDQAIVIDVAIEINEEVQKRIRKISLLLEQQAPEWMVEYIPAFTTVSVFYNPLQADYQTVESDLRELLMQAPKEIEAAPRTIEIPVCYGGKFGPDLEFVAKHNGLTAQEVVQIHSSGTYSVYMIGFAPGFPFVGGMSERIAAPRRDSPRLSIPERSVGIAGIQTGVYPIATPGGWQLIGRTPLRLFRPEKDVPSLLRAGDQIIFREITESDYQAWQEDEHAEDH